MSVAQRFHVTAEIAMPIEVALAGDEETFTDQIEQAVQDEIGHTGAAVIAVSHYRPEDAS